MEINIHGRNFEITGAVTSYIEKKIGRLDRYLPTLTEARVDVGKEQSRRRGLSYVVQVTLYETRGSMIRGEERAGELAEAVDMVVDKLHRQIGRFKGKRKKRSQKGSSSEVLWGNELADAWEEPEEDERRLVRTKRFAMSPMNVDEAIEQMELLGHVFFVYYDADEGDINVVYSRRDGNYGRIIPELA